MNARSHRFRIVLVAAVALAFVATSCGSSGGSDASTTTAAKKASTTTEAKTTTTAANGDRPSEADLKAILPSAADIGTGWTLDEAASEDTSTSAQDKAMEAQCPAMKDLGTNNDDKTEVKHSFTNAAGEQIEVSLTSDADKTSKTELADKIEAVNSCGPVSTTEDGVKTTIEFQAAPNDTYGDFGVQLQAKVTLESEQLPQPVELNLYGLMFRIGPVGVSITGFDGLDNSTLKVTPVDTDALVAQAEAMESAVKNLGAG